MGKIAIGVCAGVLSSALQSLGLALQRKSHILTQNAEKSTNYRKLLWRAGFLLFIAANVFGSSIQITTLPIIVLSPLQSVGLVFNSVCSALLLNEVFNRNSVAGTLLIGVGAFLIAYCGGSADSAGGSRSLDELFVLLIRRQFVVWILAVEALLLAVTAVLLLSSSHKTRLACSTFYRGILFGVLSGTLSSQGLLLAKSFIEIILNGLLVKKQFSSLKHFKFGIAVILITFLLITGVQLICLNCGLKHTSTTILYPFIFCVYNINNILNGLIFYNDETKTATEVSVIVLGTVLVLAGVFILSLKHDEISLNSFADAVSYSDEVNYSDELDYDHPHSSSNINNDEEYVSFKPPPNDTEQAPFKYGSIIMTHSNSHNHRISPKRKRVLSYEQSELLSQLESV